MQVRDIIQEKGGRTVTVSANQTIHQAINILNENRIGALIVLGENELCQRRKSKNMQNEWATLKKK